MIPVPGFSAFPSGHATESRMFADVMMALLGQSAASPLNNQLDRLAKRIAENRVVAGLHFTLDSTAGVTLGAGLASWFVSEARNASNTLNWVWDAAENEARALGF